MEARPGCGGGLLLSTYDPLNCLRKYFKFALVDFLSTKHLLVNVVVGGDRIRERGVRNAMKEPLPDPIHRHRMVYNLNNFMNGKAMLKRV